MHSRIFQLLVEIDISPKTGSTILSTPRLFIHLLDVYEPSHIYRFVGRSAHWKLLVRRMPTFALKTVSHRLQHSGPFRPLVNSLRHQTFEDLPQLLVVVLTILFLTKESMTSKSWREFSFVFVQPDDLQRVR
jgi:hypothetical protein